MSPKFLSLIAQNILFSFNLYPDKTTPMVLNEIEKLYPGVASMIRTEYWGLLNDGYLVYCDGGVKSSGDLGSHVAPCNNCGFQLSDLIMVLPSSTVHFLTSGDIPVLVFLPRSYCDVLNVSSRSYSDSLMEVKVFCDGLNELYSSNDYSVNHIIFGDHLGFRLTLHNLSVYDFTAHELLLMYRKIFAGSFKPTLTARLD